MNLYDQIPGLREAVEQERFDRSVAFLGLPEMVCGVECRPLTLFDVLRLDVVGSPFAIGGNVSAVDVGVFFKLQCTERSKLAKWFMLRKLGRSVDRMGAVAEISAFIEESFADGPPGIGVDGVEYWTSAHDYAHLFGEAYGWSIEYTMRCPLKVLFPLVNVIRSVRNPDAMLFNPRSDKVRGEWLAAQNKN